MAVTYATVARVRDILEGVSVTVMADTRVEARINKAEDVINSKIGGRYTVPFASGSVPGVITAFAEDIACYFVMRTLFTNDSQNKNEWIEDFRSALSSLNAIRDGKQVVLDDNGD